MAVKKGRIDIGLDFKNVRYINPAALNIIFNKKIGSILEKYGIKIRLYNIEASVRENILELVGEMKSYFEICETAPAAAA